MADTQYQELVDAVNNAWERAYPSANVFRTDEPRILARKVNMLLDDLICTRASFSNVNQAYSDLDRAHRGIRNHWWQFWRRPRG